MPDNFRCRPTVTREATPTPMMSYGRPIARICRNVRRPSRSPRSTGVAACKKCGQTGEKHRLRFVAARDPQEITTEEDKLAREHLRITCGRCHYQWNADCIDRAPTQAAPTQGSK